MKKILWFFGFSALLVLALAYTAFFDISKKNETISDDNESLTAEPVDRKTSTAVSKNFQDLYQKPAEKETAFPSNKTEVKGVPAKEVLPQKDRVPSQEPSEKSEIIQNNKTAKDLEPVKQEDTAQIEPSIKQEPVIIAPAPLKTNTSASPGSALSADGVIIISNQERAKAGLAILKSNKQLEQAAQSKLNDMFALQYFAHVSPSGKGPGDLAQASGYTYILVGENLALGDFANDGDLVNAWMNSPGHRANILKAGFTEIGVAVGKGIYEGNEVWMAVQEFGAPKSLCAEPDAALETNIQSKNAQINAVDQKLSETKQYLDAQSSNPGENFNAKVDEYNALVNEYNALVLESREMVQIHNTGIKNFNVCMGSYM
ncbi:MAG: hypothetical protein HYY51_01410 [Candidatus Magasanikbacteria bacterium]|nr:hypothetical protein [Candidatus Magasanikbacteria bacterium]